MRKIQTPSEALVKVIVHGMQEKKAMSISILDLRQVKNAFTEFFVICSANSDTQVDAIMNSVEDEVIKALGQKPFRNEGKQNREWILMDYLDVVVHVFRKDRRNFYALEDLWGDAEITEVEG